MNANKNLVFYALIWITLLVVAYLDYQRNVVLQEEITRTRQQNQINQGLAVYMAGSSCVIKATADIDVPKFKDLAAACTIKHLEYLEGIKSEEK